jgi:replicative DNA helicase
VDPVKDLCSDLRESGAIEQDADIVSFYTVHYKIDEWDDDEASPTASSRNNDSNRNGSIENVRLKFIDI